MSYVKCSCLIAVVVLTLSYSASAMPDNRSYVSGTYFLTLDGVKCGFVRSVDGGGVTAEVIQEPAGSSYFAKKHLGQPRYEDFTLQVGFNMGKPLYDWIAQSWNMSPRRVTGSIVALDHSLTPKSERQFNQALLTETTIPAMDASSKEPAYLTVRFAPEYTRDVAPGGSKADYGEYGKNEQKMFVPCNFKFEIDGIDCSKVSKVDSFTVKQTAVTDRIGDARDYAKEPGKLEFPNLKIVIAEAQAQPFIDWHRTFVIEGKNDEAAEKNGMLTLLGTGGQGVLLRIKFYNLGIFKAQLTKAEPNASEIRKVEVEMYVERMEFLYGENTGSAPATPARTLPPAAPKGVRRG